MFPAYGSKSISISLCLRSFHVPFTSFHVYFICLLLLCPAISSKTLSNFCACSCQIMFIVLGSFHDLPCPFMLFPVLYFFQRSSILLYSLLYFNAFHFLPLSFHVRFFPCPSILCSYPFIVPSCHAQNLTDRLFGMREPWPSWWSHFIGVKMKKKSKIHTYKSNSFRVRAISLSFLFIFLSCIFFSPVSFPFTSFHVSSISVNHIFVLRSPYLISLLSLCFFSCPSDVPLISLSVRLIFLLISLSCPFHFTLW